MAHTTTITVTFNNYGTQYAMPVERVLRSIFDVHCAGQIDTLGDYYVIMIDHITHDRYAVSKEDYLAYEATGCQVDEPTMIHGVWVRPMTFDEELAWNEGDFMANVDIWGNIEVEDTFDHKYYMEHCI